jgi:4a-hydroxytetrahydrobiopterin dehydratase
MPDNLLRQIAYCIRCRTGFRQFNLIQTRPSLAFDLRGVPAEKDFDMKDITKVSTEKDLASRECKPCEDGQGRLKGPMIKTLLKQLPGKWRLKGAQQLEKSFKFPDFKKALAFTNQVGDIAEAQGHHPDVFLSYGEVRIQLSTHSVGGLTENDFILAAKVNELK